MRGGTPVDKARYWLFSDRIPVTKSLIVLGVTGLFACYFFPPETVFIFLSFNSSAVLTMPWTLVTYPLAAFSPIAVLFACVWLWIAGGSLERSWGSRTFGWFFAAVSAITALGLFAGGLITRVSVSASGMWTPLAAVTVAFALLNPEEMVRLFFIIPIKLKYLALLAALILLVSYSSLSPIAGVFSLAGCAAAYWYTTGGKRFGFNFQHSPKRPKRKFYIEMDEPTKGEERELENERLKRLLDDGEFSDKDK